MIIAIAIKNIVIYILNLIINLNLYTYTECNNKFAKKVGV